MKTFVQLKGGETVSIFQILRFLENSEGVEFFLTDGTTRKLTDAAAQNRFLNSIKEQTIFTY